MFSSTGNQTKVMQGLISCTISATWYFLGILFGIGFGSYMAMHSALLPAGLGEQHRMTEIKPELATCKETLSAELSLQLAEKYFLKTQPGARETVQVIKTCMQPNLA